MTKAARRFLVVHAHPLPDSLSAAIRDAVISGLAAAGHRADIVDLYADGFQPSLTADERSGYMTPGYEPGPDVAGYCDRLKEADGVVLVFPQWWFGMPAILKGFIDRVFVPGVAFRHAADGGRIEPLLTDIRTFDVVTTTGSPRWVTELVMRNPVRRQLSLGVARFCNPRVRFRMHSMYDLDRADRQRCGRFVERIRVTFARR